MKDSHLIWLNQIELFPQMFLSCWLSVIIHFDYCCLNFHFRFQPVYIALIFQLCCFIPGPKCFTCLYSQISFPLPFIFQSTRWWVSWLMFSVCNKNKKQYNFKGVFFTQQLQNGLFARVVMRGLDTLYSLRLIHLTL